MAALLDSLRRYDRERLPPPRLTALAATGAAPPRMLRTPGQLPRPMPAGYGSDTARALGLPDGPGGGMQIPAGVTIDQVNNVGEATVAREQLAPRLQQIATVTDGTQTDSITGQQIAVPTIQGADYARLNQASAAVAGRPHLDPANVRQAYAGQQNEKAAAESAMGGRTIEATVDMMRLGQLARPRTQEAAARLADRNFQVGVNRDANAAAATARQAEIKLVNEGEAQREAIRGQAMVDSVTAVPQAGAGGDPFGPDGAAKADTDAARQNKQLIDKLRAAYQRESDPAKRTAIQQRIQGLML